MSRQQHPRRSQKAFRLKGRSAKNPAAIQSTLSFIGNVLLAECEMMYYEQREGSIKAVGSNNIVSGIPGTVQYKTKYKPW